MMYYQFSLPLSLTHFTFNPFTPKSDQFQISPAASPETLHHTAWRTWLFIACSDKRWLYYQFSLPHLYIFSLKGWENVVVVKKSLPLLANMNMDKNCLHKHQCFAESDHFQVSPAGSQEYHITHYGELGLSKRTQMRDDYTTNSHHHTYIVSL